MKPRRSNASTNTDIFLDYWITKSELAEVLGVARSTLVIWENIAFWRIEAFRQAYPTKADGSSDRESPLSPYQAWVLGRIGRTMQRLQRQTRVKDYIQRNPYNSLGNYLSPATVQHGVTIPQFDVNSAMGTNLYSSESTIPETSIQDATRHRRVVARQSNSLDVALDVTARNRKALKLATEIRHLEGDAVDYHTAGIQTATKAVRNQIADRDYQIEDSKLEQKDALLEQQRIATAGTQALTPLIQEEWGLKVEQQKIKNESLKVDIEKGVADVDRKKNELEVKLLEASIV